MANRPRGFWRQVISDGLRALGGQAWSIDLYEWIAANVALTDHELAESPHQGRPYYVNTVRGIESDMTDRGDLARVQRGMYRLP